MIHKRIFQDIPLRLYAPEWGSQLAGDIVEIERLRVTRPASTVPDYLFFQIKTVFQILESLGSARIEGNRTTLADLVNSIVDPNTPNRRDEQMLEIHSINRAIAYIEDNIAAGAEISAAHILEIHRIITDGLLPPPYGEGSQHSGELRTGNVQVQGAAVVFPDAARVPAYFDELLDFINAERNPQDDLLATAMAHHRFLWIHPFDNGNGRTVRMLTYAMLIKQGFQIKAGRILNPSAVFCMDRDAYYKNLARADGGGEADILAWCGYVVGGLKKEIEKINRLSDRTYMADEILLPALAFALERRDVSRNEFQVLCRTTAKNRDMILKSSDIEKAAGIKMSSLTRTRLINKLKARKILAPTDDGARKYQLQFADSVLLRGVMKSLKKNDFVPPFLKP